jgi:hypothetical protein
VILWRVLPHDPAAGPDEPGGARWFPRQFQGAGRHDNPDRYGCLYLAEQAVSAVAEFLAPFRGAGDLRPSMLVRSGRPLALAALELGAGMRLIDLDEPRVLTAERLRPSAVATRRRTTTQAYAARLFETHEDAAGLRWWSTLESAWINVTLFERAREDVSVVEMRTLSHADPAVIEAAELLGVASAAR